MHTRLLCSECSCNKEVDPLTRPNACTECGIETHYCKRCLGCSVLTYLCQNCDQGIWPVHPESVRQVTKLRAVLDATRQAAEATFRLTIGPYKEAAEAFRAALAAAEKVYQDDVRPLFDALREADRDLNDCQLDAPDRLRLGSTRRAAFEALESGVVAAFEKRCQLYYAARAAFTDFEAYAAVKEKRRKSLKTAAILYAAGVERAVEIARAEQQYRTAVQDYIR